MRWNNNNRINHVGLALFGFVALLVNSGCGGGSEPDPLYVGQVISPDAMELAGDSAVRGVRLAVADVNNTKDKKMLRPIAVLQANTAGSRNAFEAQAVRLTHINQVTALLGGWTAEQTAGLNQDLAPVVSPSGSRGRGNSESVFLTGLPMSRKGSILARVAFQHLPMRPMPKPLAGLVGSLAGSVNLAQSVAAVGDFAARQRPPRIAVLVDQRREPYSAAAAAFIKDFASHAAAIDENVRRPVPLRFTTESEMTALISRVKTERPDALFVAADAAAIGQMRAKLDNDALPILFAGPEGAAKEILANRRARNAVWLVSAWSADVETAANQKFLKEYRKRYQEEPDARAALAFDNARVLFEALRQCDNYYTRLRIHDKLKALKDFPSLTGKASFNADRLLERPALLLELRDGRARLRQTL